MVPRSQCFSPGGGSGEQGKTAPGHKVGYTWCAIVGNVLLCVDNLIYRHECLLRMTTHKIYTKVHPGLVKISILDDFAKFLKLSKSYLKTFSISFNVFKNCQKLADNEDFSFVGGSALNRSATFTAGKSLQRGGLCGFRFLQTSSFLFFTDQASRLTINKLAGDVAENHWETKGMKHALQAERDYNVMSTRKLQRLQVGSDRNIMTCFGIFGKVGDK